MEHATEIACNPRYIAKFGQHKAATLAISLPEKRNVGVRLMESLQTALLSDCGPCGQKHLQSGLMDEEMKKRYAPKLKLVSKTKQKNKKEKERNRQKPYISALLTKMR